VNDLDRAGFALADITLADHQCQHLATSLPEPTGGRAGVRNLIGHPTVLRLLLHERLGGYLWSMIGRDLVAVNATLFDEPVESSWRVRWHQDRAITVKERLAVPGYEQWSTKAGTLHVEPPVEVLAQMIAIRVHLDECGAQDSPLRVIAGSHRAGKLTERQMAELVAESAIVNVTAAQGSIVIMRPLLVHSSSPALNSTHRRVLHIELAPLEAISPLKWHTAVQLRRAA
jgi:ectoine hydroxylase-related dioxygenase (phytanoyl-CoA dioxygenase family)